VQELLTCGLSRDLPNGWTIDNRWEGHEPAGMREALGTMVWWLVVAAGTLLVLAIAVPYVLFYVLGLPVEGEHLGGAAVGVRNRTGEAITIQWLSETGDWRPLVGWDPPRDFDETSIGVSSWHGRYSLIGREGCTYVPLRALTPSGGELERKEPPLCEGDTWIIDGQP